MESLFNKVAGLQVSRLETLLKRDFLFFYEYCEILKNTHIEKHLRITARSSHGKHLCQNLFFNKVVGLRPVTLLKKRPWHKCFPVNFAKFLRTSFCRTALDNCFWTVSVSKWVSYLCSTTIMSSYVFLFIVLERHSIWWRGFLFSFLFFFCYIVILFVNNKQNVFTLFKLNPLCDKKATCVKKSFDLFLLCVYNKLLLILEVLYEKSYSMKGAAQTILK